jgi:hypothetical protein
MSVRNSSLQFSRAPRLGRYPAAQRVHQADPPRSVRIITPDVLTAVTPKGNQIRPHQTRRALTWAVDATARSYTTVRKSARAIHVLSNTVFTATARVICMRPASLGEVKPKSYSRPRDLSRHAILGTTSRGVMENSDEAYQNMPPLYPVQTKQKTRRSVGQMQKRKQKSRGRGNIRRRFTTKTRQDQGQSALRRLTSSGSVQHRRHPRMGCCYRSS